ncbi:MAG: hypothetical protein RLZZ383_1583, partial [Pseudomonadota bacterium]
MVVRDIRSFVDLLRDRKDIA